MAKAMIRAISSTEKQTKYESVERGILYWGPYVGVSDGQVCFAEVTESDIDEYQNKVIKIITHHVEGYD